MTLDHRLDRIEAKMQRRYEGSPERLKATLRRKIRAYRREVMRGARPEPEPGSVMAAILGGDPDEARRRILHRYGSQHRYGGPL